MSEMVIFDINVSGPWRELLALCKGNKTFSVFKYLSFDHRSRTIDWEYTIDLCEELNEELCLS